MRSTDKIIEEAMKKGEFDGLAGHGKPLSLDINPNADPEWDLAYHLLKENGFAPAFIEERQAIEQGLAAARKALAATWARRAEAGHALRWQQARAQFEAAVEALNKTIRDYNLSVPLDSLARRAIGVDHEIARIQDEGG